MRALLIAAGLFFSVCGGLLIYAAVSGSGNEYDLKLVLPIDTRQMPKPATAPEVASQAVDTEAPAPVTDGRAEAGIASAVMPNRPPVQFEKGPGAASEASPQE
ncbi:MAG: hypothetical protein ACLPPF_15505 [Rhodomicrobium sp.]